jgi:hypothetical protein
MTGMTYFMQQDAVGHADASGQLPQPAQSFEPLKANADAASKKNNAADTMIFFI